MPGVIATADRALTHYLEDERAVDPALAPVVIDLAARHGGAERFGQFLHHWKRYAQPEEQRRSPRSSGRDSIGPIWCAVRSRFS